MVFQVRDGTTNFKGGPANEQDTLKNQVLEVREGGVDRGIAR